MTGPKRIPCERTDAWGGALYVKAGAVIPMWPLKHHLERGWNDMVEVHTWPGADGSFELYEDDGDTLGYRKGECTFTPLAVRNGELSVGPRRGAFKGMPPEARTFTLVKHAEN